MLETLESPRMLEDGGMLASSGVPADTAINAANPATGPLQAQGDNRSRETYTMIKPKEAARKIAKTLPADEEPLVDTTETIPLKSKKTERQQKKAAAKLKKTTVKSDTKSFLELPIELLQDVLSYLQPTDIISLLRLNRGTSQLILKHEDSIARDIIQRRYWTLSRCFHVPVLLQDVDPAAFPALLSKTWQERTQINKRPFQQHIQVHDEKRICSCMSCVLAWNNLCLLLDLAHFQSNFQDRTPIPTIPRGTFPPWNTRLLESNGDYVKLAVRRPIHYARIMQLHLDTTIATLTRQVRVGKKTCHPRRLFHLSTADIEAGTDRFLERSGPPSYEFPPNRDKYHYLEAYLPNRKWSKEEQMWIYAKPGQPHENDLAWIIPRFTPS